MKGIKVIILGAVAVLILSVISQRILFPTDILNYLQVFNFDSLKSVHNSLLADPIFQFEPWRIFAKTTIMQGELPLWNPYNAGGTPFLANPQTAIFYPLNFIYYLLPVSPALNLITYFKLSFYAYFTYLYLRSIKLTVNSSLVGSVIALCSSFPLMWIFWPHTNVFILFPFLLFLTEKLKEGRSSYKYLISITYLFGVLGGHPETLFHVGILHVSYSLFALYKRKKTLLEVFKYILLGFLLSSFMLLPFFEYVINSDLLIGRIQNAVGTFLPVGGFLYGLFPFALGAPNLIYYKVPFQQTNFQELTGGYVGTAILITSLIGAFRFWKLPFVKYITITIIILVGIIYKVWPFWLVTAIPPVSAIANQRLTGFVGFYVIVLFSIVIDRWVKKSIVKKTQEKLKNLLYAIFIIGTCTTGIFLYSLFLIRRQDGNFLLMLFSILLTFSISTFVHLFCLIYIKRKSYILYLSLVVCLIQSAVLLFYNPLNTQDSYYPRNNLTNVLKQSSRGPVLEVGNLIFPPNLNLAYGLSHVQSDDAIGVRLYSKQLKEVFPSTNFWGRINSINQWQANKMGVKYIVSDHNINLKSKVLQSKIEKIVIPKNSLIIPFTSEDNTIEEVRFLAANFNRRNTCTLELVLFENTRLILKREVRCQNTKDKMFLTIELGKVQLKKGVPYEFKLTLKNSNKKNSIGFWSNQSGTPYFELLYSASDTFKNIWTGEGVSLFINEHNNLIEGFDTYSVIRNEQTKFVVKGNASESRTVTIKKTNYPGWNVLLNGKEVPQKDNTFFKVPIEKGEHVIELLYTPFSLIVGVLVSAITALLMILSFIKHYQLKVIFEKPKNKNDIRNICILSFSISLIVYAFSLQVFEKIIKFKSTDSINWLNLHQYPKGIDFLNVLSFFAINLSVFLILVCIKYLKRKK